VRAPANRKRGEFKGKTQAMPGRDAFRKFTEVRNARSVWTIPTQPFSGAHFAVFPAELARRCVLAGCPGGGTVLDPFAGSGTTGMVADREHRDAVLVELSEQYAELLRARLRGDAPLFAEVHG
jgi:DNA modification methylase